MESVIEFLLARGLVSPQMLVEGDLRVEEIPGRNQNFRLVTSGGPGYFLKQAPPDDLEEPPLAVEAEVYRRAAEDGSWLDVQPFVPRFRLYDAEQVVLVTDLEIGLSNVRGFGAEHSVLGLATVSESLASALAACRRVYPSADGSDLAFLPRFIPGILNISRPRPSLLQHLSPAQIEIIRALQDCPAVAAAFDEIRSAWRETSLVHGDVKWANVLVRVDPQSGGPRGVMFTDWELAQWGDPAWDVGSVFHSYLAHAVLSAVVPDDSSSMEAAEAIGAALPSFYSELGRFWDTYTCATGISSHEKGELLSLAILCCIARMVQSAYEWSQEESALPGRAAALLQLALNMLSRPDDARRVVLGGLAEH